MRVVLLGALLMIAASDAVSCAEFFVSPSGSDANPGTRTKPFLTLSHARDAARTAKKPVTVYLRKGTYFQPETFALDSRDSGTTYAAYDGEDVTISGGRVISGFRPVELNGHKMLAASVPDVKDGKWNFTQLFVNGRRRPRTRLPKEGYYKIAGLDQIPANYATSCDHFRFNPGEIKADWNRTEDVDLKILHYWVCVSTGIRSVDGATHTVWLTKRSRRRLTSDFDLKVFARYYLENVREALDTPGEWYLDRSEGVLYYYPFQGEDTTNLQAIAPVLEQVVKVAGDAANPARDIRFRDLKFAHSQYFLAATNPGDVQAAVYVPGAVAFENAAGCSLENCEISQIGTYGAQFLKGAKDCRVANCRIQDLGAGGIKMEQDSAGTTVSDNEISDGGKIFPAAVGVWVGPSGNNRVLHNHVHDFNYTGISVGWKWQYGDSPAKNNLIEANHIHHIGRGVLSDLGGIYSLGESPGTVLRGNVIHDCVSDTYGGWGIYTDQASSYMIIENNIVYHTKSGGFHQHWGHDNTIRNNIFAYSLEDQIRRSKNEALTSFIFERNIVCYDSGVLLDGEWSDNHYKMDYNLYWDSSGRPVAFPKSTIEEWRRGGHDQHSVFADPMFVGASKADFRLKPGSPALALGFKQIDTSEVGPRRRVGRSLQ